MKFGQRFYSINIRKRSWPAVNGEQDDKLVVLKYSMTVIQHTLGVWDFPYAGMRDGWESHKSEQGNNNKSNKKINNLNNSSSNNNDS